MKKLKIALILVFALTCSLFLFACKEKEPEVSLTSISLSGQKTEFTEADTEFSTGDNFTVTGTFSDGTERALTEAEITITHDEIDAAFALIKSGDYDNARGTYKIKVQGTVNDYTKSASYNATIDHDWEANGDGYKCSIDGAQKASYTVDEHIVIGPAWAADPVVTGTNTKVTMSSTTGNWLTYGSISLGQSITISGTGYTTGSDTWDTPVLGIFKNPSVFMARGDTWVIGADSKWAGYNWSLHSGGNSAVSYDYDSYDDFVADDEATEWEVYYDGTASSSYWGSESSPVDFSIKWDYNKLGFIAIEVTVDGSTYYRYIKVSNSSYEVVFYAEDCVFDVTKVDVVQNLLLDSTNGFTQTTAPTKQYYAENNMIELDPDTSGIVGAKYIGSYNDGKYEIEIGTYDILADMDVEVVDEEGNKTTETKTYDLRTEQLQAGMKNFRVEFGGYSIPITINVVPSSIKSVTTSYDFGAGVEDSSLYFENAGVTTLEYDVNSSNQIAVIGTGSVSTLTAAQKKALNTTKDYYIAFRLIGDASETLADATCSIEDAVVWLDANGINVLIPVASANDIKSFTVTVKSNVTTETVVNVDFSKVTVLNVNGVIVSNTTSIDAGGVVTVEYKGINSESDLAGYDFYVGSTTRTWEKVNTTDGVTIGNVTVKGSYKDGVLTVEYKLPQLDIAAGSNLVLSYAVKISNGTNTASVTLPYNLVITESNTAFYKVNDTTYITTSSTNLSVLVIEDSRQLAGNGGISLNIQNDTGAAYDLSFTATNSGITFNDVNTFTKVAKTVLGVTGTIGDNTDLDLAALYVVRVPYETANVSYSDGFWFEVIKDSRAVNDTEYTLVNVKDGKFTVDVVTDLSTLKTGGIEGNCLVDDLQYYISSNGFKFAQGSVAADGIHVWVDGVCTRCNTKQYGTATELGMVVGAISNAQTNGFSISFTLSGNAADWGANIITPVDADKKDTGCNLGLPNLDPWGSTIGPNGVNAYPGVTGSTLYNGGAYNVFQGATECVVTITVSASMGITFYKNGVKVLNYAYTGLFSDASTPISTYIDALLANVEAYGFIFGAGGFATDDDGNIVNKVGEVGDLTVYTAALSEAQVLFEVVNIYGVVGVGVGDGYSVKDFAQVEITNLDESGDWWTGGTSDVENLTGDFVLVYTFENIRDTYWYQDCVIEFNDANNTWFDMNFLVGGGWGDLLLAATHTTVWYENGTALEEAPTQGVSDLFGGSYTIVIVRSGSTLTIYQQIVADNGNLYTAIDTFTGFTTEDLTARLTGNPYWVDNICAYVGTIEVASEDTEDTAE